MIELIPYDSAHMDIFKQTPDDVERYGKVSSEMVNPMAENGVCFTAISDGRILVVGGVLQTTQHTGYCWTMVSEYARGQGLSLIRTTKNQLEAMMEGMKLHRVETSNIKGSDEQNLWCKLLGFQNEGVMRYYDDKKRDYIRFAKYMEN